MRHAFYGYLDTNDIREQMWHEDVQRKIVIVYQTEHTTIYDHRKNSKSKRKRRMMVGGKQ